VAFLVARSHLLCPTGDEGSILQFDAAGLLMIIIAAMPTNPEAMRYHAGDSGSPVTRMSQVTTSWAVPPKTVTASA
jgi:hypothetical protein